MKMKSSVDAKAFSKALDQVSKVLKKSVLPILGEVSVLFLENKCVLTATDLETWITTEIPACGDTFSFVFSRTKDVARACRLFEGDLIIELTETGRERERSLLTTLRSGSRVAEFAAMLPEDYPVLSPITAETAVTLNASELYTRIERVRYATQKPSPNCARVDLTCVQFEKDRIFALDGYRAACDTSEKQIFPKPFMTSGKALSHLKMFGSREVSVRYGKNRVQVTDGISSLYLRMAEAPVYQLDNAVPKSYREEFYIRPKDFLRELDYLKKIAVGEKVIAVRFRGDQLFVSASSGTYSSHIKLDGTNDTTVGFDLRYMEDALQQFKDETWVKMKVSSETSPFILEAAERGDFAMVLPFRLKKEVLAA